MYLINMKMKRVSIVTTDISCSQQASSIAFCSQMWTPFKLHYQDVNQDG